MAKAAADQKTSELKDSANQLVNQESKRLTETAKQQLDSLINKNMEDSTSGKIVKDATEELLKKEKVKEVFNLFRKEKKPDKDSTDTK